MIGPDVVARCSGVGNCCLFILYWGLTHVVGQLNTIIVEKTRASLIH